ncbi:MAG: chemotaxis protein CheB [Blastocatellia bacterium]
MPNKDIIVIGASMGGIEALKTLVSGLPPKLNASIFIVLHTAPESPGILPEVLSRAGALPAVFPAHLDRISSGRIYVAPPDHHLLVEPGFVRLTRGPKENRFRPAIDPLFRSAAQAYGPRVIGVILTGLLDDGTAGLWAIRQCGGTAVVQDPNEALAPSMPLSALKHVEVNYCLPVTGIGPLLAQLTSTPAEEKGASPMAEEIKAEIRIAEEGNALEAGVLKMGEPSLYTCPECHGALVRITEGDRIRFRCHTGHAFSLDSLLAEITGQIEDSLWTVIRTIQESILLMRHLAAHLNEQNDQAAAAVLQQRAQEAEQRAALIRQATFSHKTLSIETAQE